MTAPRPIRPIDGNALILALEDERATKHSTLVQAGISDSIDVVRCFPTLPQPEPVADGDAISRAWLLDKLKSFHPEMLYVIETAPTVIPATPALEVVTVEDVVVGIEWMDREKSERHRIVRSAGDWADVAYGGFLAGDGEHTFSKKAVAAMLSVAESISWPDGHPRNQTPKEPTFLEAAKSILEDLADDANPVWVTVEQEKALRNAIESERERKEVAE